MKRINLNEDITPLSEFRAHAAAFVQKIRRTKRPVVITQNGKSSAVVLDVNEYEALLEKIELLQDIHLAQQQIADGGGVESKKAKEQILKNINQ